MSKNQEIPIDEESQCWIDALTAIHKLVAIASSPSANYYLADIAQRARELFEAKKKGEE